MTDNRWGIYFDSVADVNSGQVLRGDVVPGYPELTFQVGGNLTEQETLALYLYGALQRPDNNHIADMIRAIDSPSVNAVINMQNYMAGPGQLLRPGAAAQSQLISDFFTGKLDQGIPAGTSLVRQASQFGTSRDFNFAHVDYSGEPNWETNTFIWNNESWTINADAKFIVDIDANGNITRRVENLQFIRKTDNYDYLTAGDFKSNLSKFLHGEYHDPFNIGKIFSLTFDNPTLPAETWTQSTYDTNLNQANTWLGNTGFELVDGVLQPINRAINLINWGLQGKTIAEKLSGAGQSIDYEVNGHALILGTALDDKIDSLIDFSIFPSPAYSASNSNSTDLTLGATTHNRAQLLPNSSVNGDYVYSGYGNDDISGSKYNDHLYGGQGADLIDGEGGYDEIGFERPLGKTALNLAVIAIERGIPLLTKEYGLEFLSSNTEFDGDKVYNVEYFKLSDSADKIYLGDIDGSKYVRMTFDLASGNDLVGFTASSVVTNAVLGDSRTPGITWWDALLHGGYLGAIKNAGNVLADIYEKDTATNADLQRALASNTAFNDSRKGLAFQNVETFQLSNQNDAFLADRRSISTVKEVLGGGGDDTIFVSHKDDSGNLLLDGGVGNDYVIADGAGSVTTIGGAGRDWIYNHTAGGKIYGDTIDGLDPETHQSIMEEQKTNANNSRSKFSDSIWWSSATTVMDADHYDHLTFYGFPLVGGNTSGGLGLIGGTGAGASFAAIGVGASQTFTPATQSYYFDELFSFIIYKPDFTAGGRDRQDSQHDLLVFNEYDQLTSLFGFGPSIQNPDKGLMRIKNFDFVYSYSGFTQIAQTLSGDDRDKGTFGMLFKKANPIWEVLAKLPDSAITVAITGGGSSFGPLIDEVLTGAAYAIRYVKALSWNLGQDPLVLDLTGRGLNTTSLDGSQVHFDLNNNFFSERTGWIGAGAGLLALDKNGNGLVDDASELFGNFTGSGLADLAQYDLNHDGKIDRADAVYARLQVWQDLNGDGVTQARELSSLADLGIASISLSGQAVGSTTPQGNTIRTYSTFTRNDGTTSGVYEAIFATDQTDTVYRGEVGQPSWAGAVVDVKGFGQITNLAVAVANDFDLAQSVRSAEAAMTTPELRSLVNAAAETLGLWGEGLNLTRELTPVLLSSDGKTLLDRAVYVEDGSGGYYTLKSGAAIVDAMGNTILRPNMQDILAQAGANGAHWQLQQAWSPVTRGQATQFKTAAPYLTHIVGGRAVIDDYGIQNVDGSWRIKLLTVANDNQLLLRSVA